VIGDKRNINHTANQNLRKSIVFNTFDGLMKENTKNNFKNDLKARLSPLFLTLRINNPKLENSIAIFGHILANRKDVNGQMSYTHLGYDVVTKLIFRGSVLDLIILAFAELDVSTIFLGVYTITETFFEISIYPDMNYLIGDNNCDVIAPRTFEFVFILVLYRKIIAKITFKHALNLNRVKVYLDYKLNSIVNFKNDCMPKLTYYDDRFGLAQTVYRLFCEDGSLNFELGEMKTFKLEHRKILNDFCSEYDLLSLIKQSLEEVNEHIEARKI
jgi:hypothetical protein